MTSDTWSREDWELIKRIFDLVSKLPPREWSSALERYLPGNFLFRQAVEELLASILQESSTNSSTPEEMSSELDRSIPGNSLYRQAAEELVADPNIREGSTHGSTGNEMSSDWEAVEQFLSQRERGKVLLRPGEVLAGRYEIVKFLGRGGMADVYEAQDKDLRRPVALKAVRKAIKADASCSEEIENFKKEVNFSLRVAHRNVCRVFDIGHHIRDDGQIIFLTMELLPGETLSARLKRTGRLDTTEALEIAKQLCKALHAAHDAGVLHRDFKCNNIMLIGSGKDVRAVVTDFGIACWTQPEKHLTEQGTPAETITGIPGTPVYMSPEQLTGSKLTRASDIYSLGLVLYEMVTGRRPFYRGPNGPVLQEAKARLTEDPKPPAKVVSRLNKNWNKSILRCLERDPDKRFPSAKAVIDGIVPLRPAHRMPLLLRLATTVALILPVIAISRIPEVQAFFHPLPRQKNVVIPICRFAGSDPGYQAIAYGLTKSLTENLSLFSSPERPVWVVPFSEVQGQMQSIPANNDGKHPQSELGVNLLVTCELGKTDSALELNVEVKDTKTFGVLRSRVIKIPETETITLEDRLLGQVAEMLEVDASPAALHNLPIDQTTVPEAYRLYERGRGYLAQQQNLQDLNQAIAILQEAVQKDSNFAIAHADLGDAYYQKYVYTGVLQWLNEAQKEISHSIAINSKLSSAHSALGKILQQKGDRNGAISEFRHASILDLASDETRCQLATAYDKAGLKSYAEQLLQAALKRNPKNWMVEDCLGALYYHNAQYSRAESYFSEATRTAPGSPMAFLNLGAIDLSQARYREAEIALRTAIKLKPTASAYSNLGTAQFYLKNYNDAAESFKEATDLRPGDYRLWSNLGDAETLAGSPRQAADDYRRALQELNRVLPLNLHDCEKLAYLPLYHAKLGDKGKARLTLANAHAEGCPGKKPGLLFTYVLIYELIGNRSQALYWLKLALKAGYSPQEIQNAPELDQMRKDQRYKRIVEPFHPQQFI